MKVHLQQIPPEGKQYEGEDPSEVLDLQDPEIIPASPVRYDLHVGLSGGGLFATGRVGADLRLQCVKCLERFIRPIEVADFACQVELTGAETVDLTDPIREDILLALPAHPHCDWDGRKACPGTFPAALAEDSSEPLSERPEVWSALDQLKIKP